MVVRKELFWSLLPALALITACASKESQAARAAAKAEIEFRQGENATALRAINEAIGYRDDISEYWILMGKIATALADYPGAFNAYENAVHLDHGNIEALRLLCQLGLTIKDPDKVDKYADELLLLAPDDLTPLITKGGAALQRSDEAGALKFAEMVLAKSPQDNGALILKARVLAARGNPGEAAKLIERSIGTGGDDGPRLNYLKSLYSIVGDRNNYDLTLERLASSKPNDPSAQLEYADMLFQTGQAKTANAIIFKVMEQHPNDIKIASRVVNIWLDEGPNALPLEVAVAEASKVSLQMKAALAEFANEMGHPEAAVLILKATPVDATPTPNNADALAALAYAIGLQGRRTDAVARLDDIIGFDQNQPKARLALARLLAAERNYAGAIEDARAAVAQDPSSIAARLTLYDILFAAGTADLATTSLREAIKAAPENPRLTARLAAVLMSQGARSEAKDALRDLTRAAPVSLRATRLRETLDPTA